MKNGKLISLGFTEQRFAPGVHICQIFSSDDERQDALMKFVLSGLEEHERTGCFTDQTGERDMADFLRDHGIDFVDSRKAGALSFSRTADIYFQNNRFDPDRMLEVMARFYRDSVDQGYSAARVIGEMEPIVQHTHGGERLLEYESRISMLLRTHPITSVCQYDARHFSGATIMNVLKVHPLMVIRGSVVHNPFYIKPEEFLGAA